MDNMVICRRTNEIKAIGHAQTMEKKRQQFSIGYFILALIIMMMVQNYFASQHTQTIPYNQFKDLLAKGLVENLAIGEKIIQGTIKGPGVKEIITVLRDETGKTYLPTGIESKGSGHHREATLIFPKVSGEAKRIQIVIKDVAGVKERTFDWDVQ